MTNERALLYVEMEMDRCSLTYGESPCTAALGETGTRKCFNTRPNCQDPDNYSPEPFIYRFARATDYLPDDIACIPNLQGIQTAPTKLNPGANIGQRESVTITFHDHPYHDIGIDKYASERRTGAAQFAGYAVELDGEGDYVSTGFTPSASDLSGGACLEAVVNLSEDHANDSRHYIGYEGTPRFYLGINVDADGDIAPQFGFGNNWESFSQQYPGPGLDVHLALSWDGNNTVSCFVEGIHVGDFEANFDGTAPNPFHIGRENGEADGTWGQRYFHGSIREVRVWNAPRTASELIENRDANLSGDTPDLLRYWPLNDGSGSTAEDATGNNDGTLQGDASWLAGAAPGYDPMEVGTFWGKWRNRNRYFVGRPLRVIQGTPDQSLSEMETRHYVIESIAGPDASGTFQVTAKDALKLADDDRAQAPKASPGTLSSGMSAGDSISSISVQGTSDSDYSNSGHVRIGKEVFSYTSKSFNSGLTTLSGVSRAQLNTEAEDHEATDNVQWVLSYESVRASDIVRDLLVNYAGVPASRIPISTWNGEDDEYINRLYSADIAEPVGVRDLINELSQQVGFFIWDEITTLNLRFRAIRTPGTTAADVTDDRMVGNAPTPAEQPKKRRSQVWVFFGLISPTEPLDEPSNFRSISVTTDPDAASSEQYGQDKIEKIYSRWISRFNRPAAEDVGRRILERFRNPPRKYEFQLPFFNPGISTGDLFMLRTRTIQQDTGEIDPRRSVVLSFERGEGEVIVEAEEFNFSPREDSSGTSERTVVVDSDTLNFNLRSTYDSIYATFTGVNKVICIVESGAVCGATSGYAFVTGNFPSGVTVEVIVRGRIQGYGGDGNGGRGGNAMRVDTAINLDNQGQIWAGGGAGGRGGRTRVWQEDTVFQSGWEYIAGGGGGGGGAGYQNGSGGSRRSNSATNLNLVEARSPHNGGRGSRTGGGNGGRSGIVYDNTPEYRAQGGAGGDGGGPGQPGEGGQSSQAVPSEGDPVFGEPPNSDGNPGSAGGQPGNAIVGHSNVSYTTTGDIRGSRVG